MDKVLTVLLFLFCPVKDFTAAERLIRMKFWTVSQLCLLTFLGWYHQGPQMSGPKRGI